MRLWRVLPYEQSADRDSPGGALWFPRELQGAGRHDNPDLYGCLYLALEPVSAVAEHLAPFRGSGQLLDSMFTRSGLPLALVEIDLAGEAGIIDLDNPSVLLGNNLRPSLIATRHREATQAQAARLFRNDDSAVGIRWWSVLESSWINFTIFDRARDRMNSTNIELLGRNHPVSRDAASLLGLRL